MNKDQVRNHIRSTGIVPVIRASTEQKALMAVEALLKGGIDVVEVTLTVPGAQKVIESLGRDFAGDLLVGAGTVTTKEDAKRCLDAGAQFVVSPGLDTESVAFVKTQNVLMVAGALTPTEVLTAWKAGADIIKIFPCNAVGGASYIKSLRGPFPRIAFIPTGGVNLKTAADFIRAGAEALGVGGELVFASALEAGRPQEITDAARQFLAIVCETRGAMAESLSK